MPILYILFGIVLGMVIGAQWQVIGTLNRIIDLHRDEEDEWTNLMTDEDD